MTACVLVLAACVSAEAEAPLWPMYRGGPQRTGRSPFAGPTKMRVRWAVDLGHEIGASAAVGADGTVYVGAGPILYAVSREGRVLWRHDFVASGHCKKHSECFTSPSPALAPDGVLFQAGGLNGKAFVLALDTASETAQRVKWAHRTNHEMRSSPLLANGSLFVGCRVEGGLLALGADGGPLWDKRKRTLYNVTSSPALSHDRRVLYVGGFDGRLHAVAADTGRELWSVGREPNAAARSPQWDAHGRVVHEFTTAGHVPEAPAVGDDGTVYFGSWDGRLYAAAPDGRLRWSFDLHERVTSAPAVTRDGRVLVLTFEGRLACVRAQAGRPRVLWRAEAGARYSSPLVTADGKVYVGTLDGRLCAYRLADGEKLGQVVLEGWIVASPAPGGRGVLYVGASDGRLYAIE